jgi:hypothetical protein
MTSEPELRTQNWLPFFAFATYVILLSLLFLTPIIPTVDFYSHVLRYYALAGQLDGLEAYYRPDWRVLPNLGLDLIGFGVASTMPPIFGAKVILALLITASYWGGLVAAKILTGRLSYAAIAIFGITTYSHIFSWGFANFLFGLSLAFFSYGVWIRLASSSVQQITVAAFFSITIMVVHALSFMIWGLVLACHELGVTLSEKGSWKKLPYRWLRLLIVALPGFGYFIVSETSRSGSPVTSSIANLADYARSGQLAERLGQEVADRTHSFLRVSETNFPIFDLVFGTILWLGIGILVFRNTVRIDPRVWPAVALFATLVVVMPPNFFGVGHVDERMPLVLISLLAVGMTTSAESGRQVLIYFGALLVVKLGVIGLTYVHSADRYDRYLSMLDLLEPGLLITTELPPEQTDREGRKFCAPLAPIATLVRSVATPTFDNPGQQPMQLAGRLKDANDVLKGTLPSTSEPAAFAAGFDYLILCPDVNYGFMKEGDGPNVRILVRRE